MVEVSLHDLTSKYRSKLDLYNILTHECKYINLSWHPLLVLENMFLPSYRHCSYKFIIQILNDVQKKSFRKDEILKVEIRRYKELRMSNILKQVLPHPVIESYLPDKKGDRYRVDEWFVLSIINKIEPDWFGAIAEATFAERYRPKDEDAQVTMITMTEAMKKALMESPF